MPKNRRPVSLIFFAITAVVLVLQMVPVVGFIMMFMLAMVWPAILINLGMLGVLFEALTGRVSRLWLVLPVLFYGIYWTFAAIDHATLAALRTEYDSANAKVAVPFDPQRQALVFVAEGNDTGDSGSWYIQNYALPVAYSKNGNYPEGFRSTRMMAKPVCAKAHAMPTASAARIYTFGFFDGDAIRDHKMEARFCNFGMPERPSLPQVVVTRRKEHTRIASLPVSRLTSTVTTPDGKTFVVRGGFASPLTWVPLFVGGCGLYSSGPKSACSAGFYRSSFTPILAGTAHYSRDSLALARALGLKPVAIADRKGGDEAVVMAKMAEVEAATLARQLAAVDRMIADPFARNPEWDLAVLTNSPAALAARAGPIMTALERAASATGDQRGWARESGRILARLVARFAPDQFAASGPRVLALYRTNFAERPEGSAYDRNHWLWESESLLRRLGDLGPSALFVLTDPRASNSNVNGAGIEGMCRVGAQGKDVSAPVLLAMWQGKAADDHRNRQAIYVAMKRIGIAIPAFVENDADRTRRERTAAKWRQKAPMEELEASWGSVSPQSPAEICMSAAQDRMRSERLMRERQRR